MENLERGGARRLGTPRGVEEDGTVISRGEGSLLASSGLKPTPEERRRRYLLLCFVLFSVCVFVIKKKKDIKDEEKMLKS